MRSIVIALFMAATIVVTPPAGAARAASADIEARIGQMIMVGFVGRTTGSQWFRTVLGQIADGKLGGVLYLKRNIASRAHVVAMNEAIIKAAGDRAPPLIAVDQEGGLIQRLTWRVGFPDLPAASRVASRMSPKQAFETYAELGRNLYDWGFNLNLGPVVDVNANPANPVIGRLGRSFSADPQIVKLYADAFIKGHRENGVLTAIKHFPGHGSSTRDSHDGIVDVSGTWSDDELTPFREIILDGNADMVMTAHVRNRHLQAPDDADPISLSRKAIQDVLRDQMGFKGVVISDDMQMAGVIDRHRDLRERVLRAVMAGTDILIFANDKHPQIDIPERVIAILANEAADRPEVAARINESYDRIIALKRNLSIHTPERAEPLITRSIRPAENDSVVTHSIERKNRDDAVVVVTPQVMTAMTREVELAPVDTPDDEPPANGQRAKPTGL